MEELVREATDLIYRVKLTGDRYVISRYGKPAAALVSLSDLAELQSLSKRSGRRLGRLMEEAAATASPTPEFELANAVERSINEVRKERREHDA